MGQQTQATWDNRHGQHGTADMGNGTADTGTWDSRHKATWDNRHR